MESTDITFELQSGHTKPFLTISQQLDLLKSRKLIIPDETFAFYVLKYVHYYRLMAYSLTLKKNDEFYPGITFENIYTLYRFDDEFRKLILKYSLCIEIEFRSTISQFHSDKYGPLGYMDKNNFENEDYHTKFIEDLSKSINKSDDVFVYHHKKDLGAVFPFWVAIECSSFGDISKFYKNMLKDDRMEFAQTYFGLPRGYVENWLQLIVYGRNIAAHGGRFYNRELKTIPAKIAPKNKRLYTATSPFALVYAIYYLQPDYVNAYNFMKDIEWLFYDYPFADKKHLGFPSNWKELLVFE